MWSLALIFAPMIIGFDAKRLFHNHSGLGQYSRYTLTHLSAYYPHHDYVLFDKKGSPLFDLSSNMTLEPLPKPAFYSRSINMSSLWKKSGIEVYHGLSNELPLIPSSSVKTVVTIHDLLYLDFPQDYPWVDRQIYHFKTKRAVQQADHIVAISETTKRELVERLNVEESKISVIYQSCRPAFFAQLNDGLRDDLIQKIGIKRPFLLCVSTFSNRKDQEVLIRAFHKSGFHRQMDLVLVGASSHYRSKMKNLAKDLGIEQAVIFPDNLGDTAVLALYHACYFVVYPSKKEGFGIPVLEGIACGKPVIVRAGTSCQEAGGNAVLTFDGTSENLCQKMQLLNSDEILYSQLVEEGFERIKMFNPKKEMARLMAIYEGLVG